MKSVQDILNANVEADGALLTRIATPTSVKNFSGSTDAVPTTVTDIALGGTSRSIHFKNDDGVSIIQVSLDGKTTWLSVDPGESIDVDLAIATVSVKSADASVPFTLWVVM
jgi:hypothetical protein